MAVVMVDGCGGSDRFYPPQTPPTHNEQKIGQDAGKSVTPTPSHHDKVVRGQQCRDSDPRTASLEKAMSSQKPWKLSELERSLVVRISFEVGVRVASDGVSCEADLAFILWKVQDPPQCFH